MLIIGSHVSFNSSSQLLGSVKEAISYGANTFMIYTGAPQNTKRCKLDYDLTVKAIDMLYENNIKLENVIIHAPYIINLANNEKEEETLIDFASYGVSNNELRLGQERNVVNRNLLRDRGLLSIGDEGLVDFESGQRHRVSSVVGSLRRNNNNVGSGNGNNGVHRGLTNIIQPLDEVSDQSLLSNSNDVMGAMHFNSFTSQETI
jgi:hypothetical protein